MRKQERREEIAAFNERSLSTLSRAITLSDGHFALILVRCNYESCSQQMWQQLQEITAVPLSQLVLPKSITTLFPSILSAITSRQTSALVVFGLEAVTAIDQVLISTNQVREEFRKSLAFPLVLWVTDEVLQKLTRFASDFKSWAATSIKFELPTDKLLTLWHQRADELFATILARDMQEFLPNEVVNLAPNCRRRQELESALRDLHSRGVSLEPKFRATWQFILGRDAFSQDQIDVALKLYRQSLDFWQQQVRWGDGEVEGWEDCQQSSPVPPYLERIGVLLHHMGLCYYRTAQLQRFRYPSQLEQAKELFSAAIETFATAGRADCVAQLMIQLGEVLQYLKSWTELQALALQSLEQPQIQNSPVQLAQAYSFLAVIALVHSDWNLTKDLAITALSVLKPCQSPPPHHTGLYLLILAKAQRQLGESTGAITSLEQALNQGINVETVQASLQQQPQLYIDILEELRSLYFEQRHYLRAFELRQQRRLVEQQHGFCTFIGAAPLQPLHQSRGIQTTRDNRYSTAPLEIAAAGRLADVNRLIERLSRHDHKLTIIHGASGVGKSSLINAGLVPTLEGRLIGAREAMPIVHTAYRDWIEELERRLSQALVSWQVRRLHGSTEPSQSASGQSLKRDTRLQEWENEPDFSPTLSTQSLISNPKLQTILEQLRLCAEYNLLTVLIFDQFEEFFTCTNLEQRCQFYEFLEKVLNLPFLKIILSLREDYLHYLLECEGYSNLSAINNNILDRQLRYHLGDLSPEDAKNVIRTLAAVSQFQLEELLIETLVQDLARDSGAVRLIELQVVGAQLQAQKITTTAQYYTLGSKPKATLVERSLLNTISDCGAENEELVWQVLFSLTDDKGTRPLKTKAELVNSQWSVVSGQFPVVSSFLAQRTTDNEQLTTDKLDLILKILVGSGLVFRVPEEPQERYQLVHDYLTEPIRQKYEQRNQLTITTQLKTSEIELNRVRRQQLRSLVIAVLMAALAVTAAGFGWRAEVQRRLATALSINAQLNALSSSSEALFVSNKQFDALLQGLRAAERLKQVETGLKSLQVEPDTRLQVVMALESAVYSVSERNRLEGHSDVVWAVNFSSDGQLIASASRDKTVKLWHPNGTLVTTLKGHKDSVTSVSFSPDSQLIASGSWDGTVKLWQRDGTLLRTLLCDVGHVYSVSFSPNGQLIACGGSNGIIQLWTARGKLVGSFLGHKGSVQSLSFSPNGQLIASSSRDKTIRLWTLAGSVVQTFKGHAGKVNSVMFSPDGKTLVSASDDRTVKLWNTNGKLLKTFPKHGAWVLGVAFSPDSQLIASASADNTIKLWNRNGTLLKTFRGHDDSVTAVSFSPVSHVSRQLSVVLDRASSTAGNLREPASVSGKGKTTDGAGKRHLLPGKQALSLWDNRQLTTDQPILVSASLDKTIKLWSFPNQSRLILQHQAAVRDVAFSPLGELIATASNDKTVKIWTRTGKLLNTLTGHSSPVCSISFSPDGQLIASASQDGTVKLWSRRGVLLKTLRGHSGWVLQVSFSPDGKRLASVSRDGTIKIWSRRGTLLKTLTNHHTRVNAISFSPDGQRLASAGDDNTVKLWTADGRLLQTLRGHNSWVLDVSFSPDSQTLASASYDNTVKLWSRDGKLIRTLTGLTDSVVHVRFSPTGKILATTSWDNRVQLWRLDDTLIKTLQGHKERVTSVSWSRDGKALVSSSQDNTVVVWNLDINNLLDKGCNWLNDYLQHNPKVRKSDRELCEPINTSKISQP